MDSLSAAYCWAKGFPFSIQVAGLTLIAYIVYSIVTLDRPYTMAVVPIAEIKQRRGLRRFLVRDSKEWTQNGRQLVDVGLAEFPGVFQVKSGSGYQVVVPNRFADELRNHKHLNFNGFFAKEFPLAYPGFDGPRETLKDDKFIQEVVRVKLTQSLGLVTEDLVDEVWCSAADIWGSPQAWTNRKMKDDVLQFVSRLSSRVFLGKELCRDEEWLEISKNYTVDMFRGAQLMRTYPAVIRPLMYWFIPECTRARQQVKDAKKLILPEVERRVKRAQQAIRSGEKVPKAADAVGWMVECARGREVNYVAAQLSLASAAIHTTSETMTRVLLQLARTPGIAEPLREEVIEVLKEDGWAKSSLSKLRLMDSFMKEVQRTQVLAFSSMNRLVKENITLSDGTKLAKGIRMFVINTRMQDPEVYDEPTKFKFDRFMKTRQKPGEANYHQFVTTSSDHMAFGHGEHACPGRFFASNEIKIALCFFLLNFEFKAVDNGMPAEFPFEMGVTINPYLQMQIRRRKPEIDFLSPKV